MSARTPKVDVQPSILEWAVQRSGLDDAIIEKKFPAYQKWLSGDKKPSLSQLEAFAKKTYTPIGYFFLKAPPQEEPPLTDLRTLANRGVAGFSIDLIDTIHECKRRQSWFIEYAEAERFPSKAFVGSANLASSPREVAASIREVLHFTLEQRAAYSTWREALRDLIVRFEDIGVLVMVNGVVGSNNRRKLDPREFRGFALSHPLAPLIFVNGSDSKSAQMFTLAHEAAHLWLGKSAVSDQTVGTEPEHEIEDWCNKVAAELLVPLENVPTSLPEHLPWDTVSELSKRFKVSSFVVLRRLKDSGALSDTRFWALYREEAARIEAILSKKGTGGNYYPTQVLRVGKSFAEALISETLEGRVTYTHAFRLLGVSKLSTLKKLGRELGVGY